MYYPIWKDLPVTLRKESQEEYVDFSIIYRSAPVAASAVQIYSGRAYPLSGNSVDLRINDICADYMKNPMPPLVHGGVASAYGVFTVFNRSEPVQTMAFTNDWSYDYGHDPAAMGMAFPINGRIDARQWLLYTAYDTTQVEFSIILKDGTVISKVLPLVETADYNDDYNEDYSKTEAAAITGTMAIDMNEWPDAAEVHIGNTIYRVVDTCCRYALYYVNAYGGWDSMLVEGGVNEKDTLTRHTSMRAYDNRDIINRGTFNYANEVVKQWTLRTGWLTDEQSSRMHHLLNATNVCLYDFERQEMIPVMLTGTDTDYKTYRNSGNRLFNYEMTVQLAQARMRR